MSRREDISVLTEARLIKESNAANILWGNEESGFIPTIFYVLSNELMNLILTIPPGGSFQAGGKYRAYFNSHACLYILSGQYTMLNPETGEVRTAKQGEMLFLHEKLWNFGYNFGDTELRMFEVFAPPADAAALASVPIPETNKLYNNDALKILTSKDGYTAHNLRLRNENNAVEAMIEGRPYIWLRVYASSERICLSVARMLPGQHSGTITAPFDMVYFTEEGELGVKIESVQDYYHVESGDVAFIPAREPHQLFNHSDKSSRILLSGAGPFASINSEII